MTPTSLSLLERLRNAAPDSPEWGRLNQIYLPLIHSWLLRVPGIGPEVDDLTQDVFVILVRELPAFEWRGGGSFRAWLRQITANRIRAFHKTRGKRRLAAGDALEEFLAQLVDSTSDLSRQWDREHDRHVFRKLMAIVKPDFEAATWQAFQSFALEGRPVEDVAGELEMTEHAVVLAKHRVLKRLRHEAEGLID